MNQVESKIIDFMRVRHLATGLSAILMLVCLVALIVKPLNLALDFTGGTLIELTYGAPVATADVRKVLEKNGYKGVNVVHYGSEHDVLVRMQAALTSEQGNDLVAVLKQQSSAGEIILKRVENVGPQVGDELKEQGFLALFLSFIGVMIYVAFRFQYKFAVGGIVALIHDALITVGMFAIFGWEFDLNVLAAVLAIIGYSINDTIVIFDRIRENFREMRKTDTSEIINMSLTQTLSRTLMTSFVTLLAVIALFFFGGETIHGFAKAMWIGMVSGVYSTIYIASNTLLILKLTNQDMIEPVKEGVHVDDMP
jgi:preprotein translocase subunit SecF